MFGLPEAMMSFIRRQIGLRTDAASVSGSLHAKVAELRSTLLGKNIINKDSVIKSIQRGTMSIASGSSSASVTISAVNTNKAFVSLLGYYNSSDSEYRAIISLSNSTTVKAQRHGTWSVETLISYEVIEYY